MYSSVYNELKNLYYEKEKNNLVIFVGAGISQFYSTVNDGKKFPSWTELLEELKSEDIKHINDPLQVPQIYQDNHSKEALVQKIRDIFPSDYEPKDVVELIFELEPSHVITTNYDSLLEKALYKKGLVEKFHIIDTDEAIPLSKSKQNLLVKAHGDLARGNIVLSEQDYSEYEQNFPLILSFIKYVFSKYKVLFIGFSLTDPNFNRILYWVKNILKENSLEHTVLLHNDISDSERKYFEKKSVKAITQRQITRELLNVNQDYNYLYETLFFIKNGHLSQKYGNKQDYLEIFLDKVKVVKYFEYITPNFIENMLKNTPLKFSNNKYVMESKDKKSHNYSWIGLIQDTKAEFNFQRLMNNDYEDIKIDKEFFDKYLNSLIEMFIKCNIGSIGYIDYSGLEKETILNKKFTISNKMPKNYKYLLSYTHSNKPINSYDNSFEKNSPYYNTLTFKENDFYSKYILGNVNDSIEELKRNKIFTNSIEKYLYFFKSDYLIHNYLTNGNFSNIEYETHNAVFNILNKQKQEILKIIHYFEFVDEFQKYLLNIELYYNEDKKSTTHYFSGHETGVLYRFSFYLNYSRFFKFILLNKLPIFNDNRVQQVIHQANIIYFKYFMDYSIDNINIPNWYLFGFLIDNNEKIIRIEVINKHLKHRKEKSYFNFDKEYIRDLFALIINGKTEKSLLRFRNIFYILSLTAKTEDNFIFLLDLFHDLIKANIKNIEYFAEAFHIAYINFNDLNKLNEDIYKKIKLILNVYIKYKLNIEETKKNKINDNKFSNFIFDLEIKYKTKDKEILKILNSDMEDISCQNLSSLIYLLYRMGYKVRDIKKNIIKPLRINFNYKDFYIEQYSPMNKCQNEVENSIVKIYIYYNKDLGIKKIEKYYINQLVSLLSKDGFSGQMSGTLEWLIFLIDNKAISKKYMLKLNNKETKRNLALKLNYIFNTNTHFMGGDSIRNSRYRLIEFLIKSNKVKVVEKVLKELDDSKASYGFIELFTYLISNRALLKYRKKELIKLLDLFKKSSHKDILLPIKQLIKSNKKCNDLRIQTILIKILKNDKESSL